MNKLEKTILRKVIHDVARDNKHLWRELKRQIFDFGYQLYYPWQDEFRLAAEHALARLTSSERELLIKEWRRANPARADWPDSKIMMAYIPIIIKEIVERARSAANRTVAW